MLSRVLVCITFLFSVLLECPTIIGFTTPLDSGELNLITDEAE